MSTLISQKILDRDAIIHGLEWQWPPQIFFILFFFFVLIYLGTNFSNLVQ